MCWVHIDVLLGTRFQPAIDSVLARKYKRVRAVRIHYRHFEIAVERCGRYRLPIHSKQRNACFSIWP
jgi:hypothetical protein